MKAKGLVIGLCCVCYLQHASAQIREEARKIVAALCSEKMQGRGYVLNGTTRAANYIVNYFDKEKARPFGKSYLQPFRTAVNTFPGKMKLVVNDHELNPGVDFLLDPGSPGIHGDFTTLEVGARDLLTTPWGKNITSPCVLVVNANEQPVYNREELRSMQVVAATLRNSEHRNIMAILWITADKLTWSVSTEINQKPFFTVKASQVNFPFRTVHFEIDNDYKLSYELQNIAGWLPGKRSDSMIVVSAHYDHLGRMGKATLFPGANDNASGMALLLCLMQYYSQHIPPFDMVFLAFSGEEPGLLGSLYFAEHPLFPLPKIKFMINFDIAGTGDEGIQVVNGSIYKQQFDRLVDLHKEFHLLKQVKVRGEACNSDHCPFYSKGVPCFYIYTLGGIQAYHDIYDRSETLPLTAIDEYFKLMSSFISGL